MKYVKKLKPKAFSFHSAFFSPQSISLFFQSRQKNAGTTKLRRQSYFKENAFLCISLPTILLQVVRACVEKAVLILFCVFEFSFKKSSDE